MESSTQKNSRAPFLRQAAGRSHEGPALADPGCRSCIIYVIVRVGARIAVRRPSAFASARPRRLLVRAPAAVAGTHASQATAAGAEPCQRRCRAATPAVGAQRAPGATEQLPRAPQMLSWQPWHGGLPACTAGCVPRHPACKAALLAITVMSAQGRRCRRRRAVPAQVEAPRRRRARGFCAMTGPPLLGCAAASIRMRQHRRRLHVDRTLASLPLAAAAPAGAAPCRSLWPVRTAP